MRESLSNPLLWIGVSILCYEVALQIKKKFNFAILNPLVIGSLFVIAILYITGTDVDTYNSGGIFINMFLTPATAVLAVPIYRQRKLLRANLLPILSGTLVGSIVSVTSVIVLTKLLKLDEVFMLSLVPKSVTTAIGIEISATLGGVPAISIVAIILSGVIGAIVMPPLLDKCKIDDSIAKGIAMGTASHAVGTSRALEMGETEGAMSGLAIGICGLITVGLSIVVQMIL